YKERRQEERQALSPSAMAQPKQRALRYPNIRTGRAEEGLLRLLQNDPSLFGALETLTPEEFSVPTFGKIFELLRNRWQEGKSLSLAVLDGLLSEEEMELFSGIAAESDCVMQNARQALEDYIKTMREKQVDSDDDLMLLRQSKKAKNTGGN
ncbi:MAG: DNA primase, partial [Oscillospiraceae bacterium]